MKRMAARLAAELIFVSHTLLIVFILVGWLMPPPYYYAYVAALFVTFVTQVLWRYCILTTWEYYFRRLYDPAIGHTPYHLSYYSHKLFPNLVSETLIDRLSLVFLSVSLAFAALHLFGNL